MSDIEKRISDLEDHFGAGKVFTLCVCLVSGQEDLQTLAELPAEKTAWLTYADALAKSSVPPGGMLRSVVLSVSAEREARQQRGE